jgi:hypothetical protein
VHRLDISRSFLSVPVASTVLVFADQWAAPAVAIVVVVWLGDVAVVRLRA